MSSRRRVCERFSKGNTRWQRKMLAGILKGDLVLRVGFEANDQPLKEPHTKPMDFTGKPMKGYIYVSLDGMKTTVQLRKWLTRGQTFVACLPPAKRRAIRRVTKTITHQPRRTSS
jgi:hypothetical protein